MSIIQQHVGSDFDSFLDSEGILDEVSAVAVKRVLAWQLEQAMKAKHLTKTEMAKRQPTAHRGGFVLCQTTTLHTYPICINLNHEYHLRPQQGGQ